MFIALIFLVFVRIATANCRYDPFCCTALGSAQKGIESCDCIKKGCFDDMIACRLANSAISLTGVCQLALIRDETGIPPYLMPPGKRSCLLAHLCPSVNVTWLDRPAHGPSNIPPACLDSNSSCGRFDSCLDGCRVARGVSGARCRAFEQLRDSKDPPTSAGNSSTPVPVASPSPSPSPSGILNVSASTPLADYVAAVSRCVDRNVKDGLKAIISAASGGNSATAPSLASSKGGLFPEGICEPVSEKLVGTLGQCIFNPQGSGLSGSLCHLSCAAQAKLLAGAEGSLVASWWEGITESGATALRRCGVGGKKVCLPYVYARKGWAEGTAAPSGNSSVAAVMARMRTALKKQGLTDSEFVVEELPAAFVGGANEESTASTAQVRASRRGGGGEHHLHRRFASTAQATTDTHILVGMQSTPTTYAASRSLLQAYLCDPSPCPWSTDIEGSAGASTATAVPDEDDSGSDSGSVSLVVSLLLLAACLAVAFCVCGCVVCVAVRKKRSRVPEFPFGEDVGVGMVAGGSYDGWDCTARGGPIPVGAVVAGSASQAVPFSPTGPTSGVGSTPGGMGSGYGSGGGGAGEALHGIRAFQTGSGVGSAGRGGVSDVGGVRSGVGVDDVTMQKYDGPVGGSP